MRRFFLLSSFLIIFSACQPATVAPAKPSALPDVSLYADHSPLNQPIAGDAELDPNSARYIEALAATAGTFYLQVRQFSSPVYFAEEHTPRFDVRVTCGHAWGLGVDFLKNVPIPAYAEAGFDSDEADDPPRGCGETSSQDNNMTVIDLARGCEYDFWQARVVNGRWVASWANAIPLDGNGIYESGLSARGSGFALLAGVIWPRELQQGHIPHALLAALPDVLVRAGGPVPPATESDGESGHPLALPEGAHLRLDPELDLATLHLTAAERVIARAMQEYGLFVTDRGGDAGIGLYAIDPRSLSLDPYMGLLPDVDYPSLSIPLDRLQVLLLPPQNPSFQNGLSLPDNPCALFE